MEVTSPEGLGNAVNEYGYAVVFLFMYIATVAFLIRMLLKQLDERKQEVASMITALEKNTASNHEVKEALSDMKSAVEKTADETGRMLTWLNSNFGGGGG